MIAYLRLYAVFILLVPITVLLMPVQYVAVIFRWPLAGIIPVYWHRLVVRLIGLRVSVHGEIRRDRPLLIVSNHVSWADIPVLASITELCFIAKSEVDEMPAANLLARLQRSVYVTRDDRRGVERQAREITERLLDGDTMVLFAEGTTGDGNRVGGFKSSLFAAAHFALMEGQTDRVLVQPVSIAYTRLHGIPMGRLHRSQAAWPGTLTLGPHAKNMILKGAWDVDVSVGEPIQFDRTTNRREVASRSHQVIREMFTRSLRRPNR